MDLPERIIKKLCCSQCNKPLSVLPIHSYENGDPVCGRCPLITDLKPSRDFTYETIAQDINFPCLYKSFGCREALTPAELQLHEPGCTFKQWMCPQSSSDCKWEGMLIDLEIHYARNHESFILGPNDKFPFKNENLENYILRAMNESFLLQYKKTSEKMLINVTVLKAKNIPQSFNYSLFIYCKSKAFVLNFPECKVNVNNGINDIDEENCYTVDLEALENLRDECVECKVLITSNENTMEGWNKISKLNEHLLKYMECSVCLEYIAPPIYHCPNSHMICKTCKEKRVKCIVCKLSLGHTRNRALENISKEILYKCKNEECTSINTFEERVLHEKECPYLPQMCPFQNCPMEDNYGELMEHITMDHAHDLLKDNAVDVDIGVVCEESNYIMQDQSVFSTLYRVGLENFYLSVYYFGPKELPNIYFFNFEVFSRDKLRRISVKSECINSSDRFKSHCIKLPLELFDSCINEKQFTFTINIFAHAKKTEN